MTTTARYSADLYDSTPTDGQHPSDLVGTRHPLSCPVRSRLPSYEQVLAHVRKCVVCQRDESYQDPAIMTPEKLMHSRDAAMANAAEHSQNQGGDRYMREVHSQPRPYHARDPSVYDGKVPQIHQVQNQGGGYILRARQPKLGQGSDPLRGDNPLVIGEGPIYVPRASNSGSDYKETLWETPLDREDPKISLGTMTNAYTGATYEIFEDAMPPPTSTRGAPLPETFKYTNPKLTWLNGGIDPNNLPPSKQEVEQAIPGADGGPNIWGDALYAERRRQMGRNIVRRDLYLNRNGDYSVEQSLASERPAGYYGDTPMYRVKPHMPPTQRGTDSLDYKPTPDAGYVGQHATSGRVRVCDDSAGTNNRLGSVGGQVSDQGGHVVSSIIIRETLKQLMEQAYSTGVAEISGSGHQVSRVDANLPTIRGTMDYLSHADGPAHVSSAGGHIILDTTARATLKTLMERSYRLANADGQGWGGHVPSQMTRATLKTLLEQAHAILSGGAFQGTGRHVSRQTQNRATLKIMMEQAYETLTGGALQGAGNRVARHDPNLDTRRMYHNQGDFYGRVQMDGAGKGVGSGNVLMTNYRGQVAWRPSMTGSPTDGVGLGSGNEARFMRISDQAQKRNQIDKEVFGPADMSGVSNVAAAAFHGSIHMPQRSRHDQRDSSFFRLRATEYGAMPAVAHGSLLSNACGVTEEYRGG